MLALTSLTSGIRSVGIVCSRTEATDFVSFVCLVTRLSQCSNYKLTFTSLQVVVSDNVDEALNDSEYLELLNNLAHLPDLSVGKTPSQHGYPISSHSIQDSLAVLEANIVSTYVLL
jgi:hypothetical protein